MDAKKGPETPMRLLGQLWRSLYSTPLPESQSLSSVLRDLLVNDMAEQDLHDAITESIPADLFVSHSMISTPVIFRNIHKKLYKGGWDTSYTHFHLHRKAPVAHKCIHAIWGATEVPNVVSACIPTKRFISANLSSPMVSPPARNIGLDKDSQTPLTVVTWVPSNERVNDQASVQYTVAGGDTHNPPTNPTLDFETMYDSQSCATGAGPDADPAHAAPQITGDRGEVRFSQSHPTSNQWEILRQCGVTDPPPTNTLHAPELVKLSGQTPSADLPSPSGTQRANRQAAVRELGKIHASRDEWFSGYIEYKMEHACTEI